MKPKNWPDYRPQEFEQRLLSDWEQAGLNLALEGGNKPKYYCLDFFPYPSGDGLHVGHCRNYVPTDVLSRYKRMRGFNVLHPMGWDAFGEPAEQFAVRFGVHPRQSTDRNTANFRRQFNLIGASYDWTREIDSSQPEFYRWTQAFFLRMYRRGLAYRDTNWQWWCDGCQTTLSSHEVVNGVCWRGHTSVYKREIPAWYFRITAYADELISGLDEVDWPESIKAIQRNWIGRSEGCRIVFHTEGGADLAVFTTRPDTLFGATFVVLAPEHPLVAALTIPDRQAAVTEYVEQARRQSEVERMLETRPKTGVFTGGYVLNPISGERIPAWIADYVLPSYGTGAVMAVPAHDPRDFEFARKFGLPVRTVIEPAGGSAAAIGDGGPAAAAAGIEDPRVPVPATDVAAYTGPGVLVNSGEYNGLPSETAAERICAALAESGQGGAQVNYRMRDWLISRQRYWGTPIPIVYCQKCGEVPVPETDLPVLLPYMTDFQPDGSGRSPLARVPEFVITTCPTCGGPARRETDTMGGFACSSWYFLRFTSPHHQAGPFEPQAMRYWMPVDTYVGGAEHAVLHLLYARFWTKVLADADLLPFREPFAKLLNQGQLLGPDGQRMSKSHGNVITPDSVVASHGADALRIYVMFMAPFDQDIAWSTAGLNGAHRFLTRVWSLYGDTYRASAHERGDDLELRRRLHQTIRQVETRIESFRFNTMVSTLMEFVNLLAERKRQSRWHTCDFHQALETLLALLAPAAPFFADELWRLTGHAGSVHAQAWPVWDSELAREETVEIPVQVDGRLCEVLSVPAEANQQAVLAAALVLPRVQQRLTGREVVKSIFVPGKVLNILTRS